MKKRLKVLAVISCISMLTASLAGCGSNQEAKESTSANASSQVVEKTESSVEQQPATEETKQNPESKEDITLKMFINIKERPDCQLVNQEISKITQEKFGFNVEIVYGNNQDKITLMLASNEQMDIGFDQKATFVDRARQGAYVDITELVQTQTPDLYDTVPEILWEGSKIDGRTYAVPTYKEYAEQWAVLVDRQVIEENNIDISKIEQLKDVEPILEALKQYPDKAGFEILVNSANHVYLSSKYNFDDLVDWFGVNRENPEEIVHYMETEEYRDFVYLMRDWYEKGYIAEDIATRADYNSYHNSGNTGMFYISYSPYAENTYNNSYKGDFVTIPVSPTVRSNKSMMGSLLGIYSKSEYVEECLQFLELLNTDPDMKNLVAYGIEGKHYNLVDGKVQKVAGANDLYKMDNYKCGNMMISYLVEGDPDDKYEQYKSFSEDAVDSPIIGFLPDTGEITNELAAISNVVSEYNSLLCVGAVDPDDYLDTMLEELKASGLDKVKEALQKQYDEWKK